MREGSSNTLKISRNKLCGCSKKTTRPNQPRSVFVGASCLLISIPGFISLYYYNLCCMNDGIRGIDEQFIHGIIYIIASLCSFISDYTYFGYDSHAHWIDNYTAHILVFANAIRSLFYIPYGTNNNYYFRKSHCYSKRTIVTG